MTIQQIACGDRPNFRAGESPYRASFACLWDEINGDRALWSSDPWVRRASTLAEATSPDTASRPAA